ALLGWLDFRGALLSMAVALGLVLVLVTTALDDVGRTTTRPPLASVLKKSPAIQRLSAARFFLFASRDIWFVVALPVFLDDMLGWSYEAIGVFLACWVIGYGLVQSLAPRLLASVAHTPQGAFGFLPPMAATAMFIAVSVWTNELQALITVAGLLGFGVMFALTSSVHSYLVLAYSTSEDETALDVGFYYSANAAGRLVGTLLSGMLFLIGGFGAALVGTAVFLVAAFVISLGLPPVPSDTNDRVDVAVP
ncbi:MFS transporter, partial [Acidimicrobiales bacterium]|nr:MFS transporter [Acidimicrobiales bacterium]